MRTYYMIDTNSYYLFFQKNKFDEQARLKEKLCFDEKITFFISEITSLEIHSVLGKYCRGIPSQTQICRKIIVSADSLEASCINPWTIRGRNKLRPRVFRNMQKLVSDIESKNGSIQADILPLEQESIEKGTQLLIKYAHRYSFSSHDALIAGSFIYVREMCKTSDWTLVTSDKGLKAMLKEEKIDYFDPLIT